MLKNLSLFFKELCENFFKVNQDTKAIMVYNIDKSVIFEEKRDYIDIETIVDHSSIVNPVLGILIDDFEFHQFGTAMFNTEEHQLLFISINKETILCLIIKALASVDKVNAYAYFLAEKIAQLLTMKEGDVIALSIPKFDFEIKKKDVIKNQIYQTRLDQGKNFRYKFIIVGDSEAGKTSIVRRFTENKFTHDYRATIGLNIVSHNIEFFGNKVELVIWDLGAQEYFKRIRKNYYQNSQAVFIVFDLTKKDTYNNIINWYNELDEFIKIQNLSIVIIGNKLDLKNQRKVDYQEGVDITKILSNKGISTISYIETSALSGENIVDAFRLISYHYIVKNKEYEENALKNDIYENMNSILSIKKKLIISFITENNLWSPGLQALNKIIVNLNLLITKVELNYQIYEYKNGLILKNYILDNIEIYDSDAVFLVFDAKNKTKIPSKWRETMIKVIDQIKEKKVILIGIQIDEDTNWSSLIEEFNINDLIEKKMISLLFFKISKNYEMEIFENLKLMFSTIESIL
ncbi:MAG: GTP-binding protein [Candidatus Lokiarchaeota archaeon]|nr:GTP-binding protein [Candidatus Lokiarchaeota archaeon]